MTYYNNHHLTARPRTCESRPARALIAERPNPQSILDWGCGRGTDVQYFKDNSIEAVDGYDPYFKPKFNKRRKYQYITCFYVLCVMPGRKDKLELLNSMKGYLKKGGQIIVAVRDSNQIRSVAATSQWKKYKDGFLTNKKTYQVGLTYKKLARLAKDAGLNCAQWSKPGFTGCILTHKKNI